MALRISMETGFGFTATEAHAVIHEFRLQKELEEDNPTPFFRVYYSGLVWKDLDAYTNQLPAFGGFNFVFELDTGVEHDQANLLRQCYLNLKTQEGFTDGVDC